MEFLDARRLTGPNLFLNQAGTVLDVRCTEDEANRLLPVWTEHVRRLLDAVGWQGTAIGTRRVASGLSLAFSAPIDALYAATELNERAWRFCECHFEDVEQPDFEAAIDDLKEAIASEANPRLLALARAASDHGVALLHDDDHASVGLGVGSQTWPVREIPEPAAVVWRAIHDVPLALVTGTNGKTTSVRLAAHIARAAGRCAGLSSTDWTAIDDTVLEHGDFAGPGGARAVLREKRVDFAVLETARGGLLRRGLAVKRADVALITNIAEDHLGDFGSQTLDELLEIKWIISRAVAESGALILNADDDVLVEKSADYPGRIVWFSLDPHNAVVEAQVANGGTSFVLDDQDLCRVDQNARETICSSPDIPITLGGAAKHNVSNALAAAALTSCLGVSLADIGRGMRSMSADSNPGRCNLFEISGARVLLDFAHNPHGMQALFDLARALPARRRLLAFGQAGDRTDEAIRELARSAWSLEPDEVIVSELESYWRGRSRGEIYGIIRGELLKLGARPDQLRHFDEERESVDAALAWAKPGDLVILLVLADSQAIHAHLKALAEY